MIEVYDNFLDDTVFLQLKDNIESYRFPWHKNKIGLDSEYVGLEHNNIQMDHVFFKSFFRKSYKSEYINLILPLLDKFNNEKLIRVKSNLTFCKQKIDHWHIDINVPGTTGIFYVNTNDGGTQFQHDNTKIESKANRMVMFPNNLIHSGYSCTNSEQRIVINFNWLDDPSSNLFKR